MSTTAITTVAVCLPFDHMSRMFSKIQNHFYSGNNLTVATHASSNAKLGNFSFQLKCKHALPKKSLG